jgi:hypothetical protein
MTRLPLAFALLVMVPPTAAFAQGTPAPPATGPLVLERIETSFIVAPDYKVTDLDGDIAHLAGGYAGWLTEDTLLVGGAAYSVANRADDFKLTYGGLLAAWMFLSEHRIQFGARGLAGLGRATLGTDVEFARFGASRAGRDGAGVSSEPVTETIRFRVQDDFFVFEPQLTMITKLTDHISVNVGAGYRITAYADRLDDRVNGATGSIGVLFDGW